ncbi:ASCH domain-containing protein [Microcoleus sp. herbarium7]|uniref:ASCH domain-containing protein n=1 Tax=Microcoleus sp. herbarium7 TaxID=3055435 RepID=UPI002FCE97F5
MNTINTKVQELQQQKEALDARIAKLEELEYNTTSVKNLLVSLLADYATEALEGLPMIWEEILAIGQQHGLSVQPLAADELREWEADRAENKRLKLESEKWSAAAAISELAVKDLRSQLAQVQPDHKPEVWHKEEIAPELENLYQETLTETDSEATARLADEEYDAAVEAELALDVDEKDIPALTLWQPWASLIQQEVKRIETRSWATNYRGPIAIHAAKKPVYTDIPELLDLLQGDEKPPLGAVVAIVNLIDCVEMTPEFIAEQTQVELKCGDWEPGRFAWILEIIRPVVPPIQVSGGQKLWNWSGTSIAAELEYLEKLKATPEPEYEPDECNDTIESVLSSHGFFMPDVYLGDCYPPEAKYEDYQDWAIYYDKHDRGVTGIGLYNEQFGFWDASTEMIRDDDPTFPQNFTDYDAIVAWTRQVINEVVAVTPFEKSGYSGQLALKIPELESEPETILTDEEYDAAVEKELGCNWEDEDEAMPEKLTELQKLLAGNSNFTFEELGVSVEIQSIFTKDKSDDSATEKVEEALITTCNTEGRHWEYYVNAQTFICQYTFDILEQAALGYAQHFLRYLEKEAKTKEKITQWNADDAQQSESAKPDTETEFEAQGYLVKVYPQLPLGVTFRFLNPDNILAFSNSLISAEIGDRTWKVCAYDLIQSYRNKEATRIDKEQNPYKKPEDEFVEFVKISNAVGYLKRRDNGQLIAGYAAFSNKLPDGNRATTQAKSRAQKWVDWLKGTFGLECDAPRIAKRMVSDNSKQPFAYEVKIKGVSIGQLTKLAKEDFSLLPGEVEERQQNTELLRSEIKVSPAIKSEPVSAENVTDKESLTEKDLTIVDLIQKALLKFDAELIQSTNVTAWKIANRTRVWNVLTEEEQKLYELLLKLEFAQAPDFSVKTPEFITTVDGKQGKSVFLSLRVIDGVSSRVWRYQGQTGEGGYPCKEAAAVAAWKE